MRRLIAELLAELRATEEHERLEVKEGAGKSALETVLAFSNEPDLHGGYLLFGIRDEEGFGVVGVEHPEKLSREFSTQCSDETFNRPVRPTLWTETVEGKQVVAAFVPEARPADKPIYLRKKGLPKGAYRRISNTDVRCSDDDLKLFHERASGRPYEDKIVDDASMEDLDDEAISAYRKVLIDRNPATEMRDATLVDLVVALGGARKVEGQLKPTVAGVLLFGKPLALRRLFPLHRIDFIRVTGTEWLQDTEERYETIEVRQPLLKGFRKIYRAILDGLPKTVSVPTDAPERVENPSVPERVIREALMNAICHRDYSVYSPIQIIRYSNRIEFRNAGHSLIAEERFGEPGSETRNPRIADVFREMGLAENKGSGIRVMFREMEKAKLTRPLLDTNRAENRFVTKLFFRHLLAVEQREWLASLADGDFSHEQELALVFCRETHQIRNVDLRNLCGLETLAASRVLSSLRDKKLLEMRGASTASYYVLCEPLTDAKPAEDQAEPEGASEASVDARDQGELFSKNPREESEGKTQGFEGKTQGFEGKTQGFEGKTQGLPKDLQNQILNLGKRPKGEVLQAILLRLCEQKPYSPSELAEILALKDVNHLVKKHIKPLLEAGKLERTIPSNPSHPKQAYQTVRKQESSP